MNIKADMKMVTKGSLIAIGDVTIDEIIKISGVKVLSFDEKKEQYNIYLPRKKTEKGWQNVLQISDQAVRKQIEDAVYDGMARDLKHDVGKTDSIEVSVKPYRKDNMLGYATVTYQGAITIRNIRIYEDYTNDQGFFESNGIRLVYPYSMENGNPKSLINTMGDYFEYIVREKVKQAYEAALSKNPEKERKIVYE